MRRAQFIYPHCIIEGYIDDFGNYIDLDGQAIQITIPILKVREINKNLVSVDAEALDFHSAEMPVAATIGEFNPVEKIQEIMAPLPQNLESEKEEDGWKDFEIEGDAYDVLAEMVSKYSY